MTESGQSGPGAGQAEQQAKTRRRRARTVDEKRDQVLRIKLSREELDQLRKEAERRGQSVGAWAGNALIATATGQVETAALRETGSALLQVRAQLAAIGNNVNQIAKGVNAGQPLEATQAAAMYRFIRAHVNTLDAELDRLRPALRAASRRPSVRRKAVTDTETAVVTDWVAEAAIYEPDD